MFEKCIKCPKIGDSCVPNLMLLPFDDLIHWCIQRQKYLGLTNHELADKSKVPEGTIGRIKGGDYMDCRYSTIKSMIIALIGGTTDEFSCTEQIEREMRQKEQLEQQASKLSAVEEENRELKNWLSNIDEQHRKDIRAVREEYQEQIVFLKEQLKAWQEWHQKQG